MDSNEPNNLICYQIKFDFFNIKDFNTKCGYIKNGAEHDKWFDL